MSSDWFETDYYKSFNSFRNQVLEFNRVGGREITEEGQLSLCYEEAKELVEEYGEDKVAFLKEVCDLFVVSCPAVDNNTFKNTVELVLESTISISDVMDTLRLNWDDTTVYLDCAMQILMQVDADWQKAMQLVLDSNMSKFSRYNTLDVPKYDNHCVVLECGGRYPNVVWENVHGWVVWKDVVTNKVLKGLAHIEVDLSDCVK